MDVNSGSIHVADDLVYEIIPLVEELVSSGRKDAGVIRAALREKADLSCSDEALGEAVEEILELEATGQLFAPDLYEN